MKKQQNETALKWSRFRKTLLFIGMAILDLSIPWVKQASAQAEKAPSVVNFEDYFVDKSLRMEFFQCGDAKDAILTLHEIFEEPTWPETTRNLITPFAYGKYAVRVYDEASNRLIYSRGFDTMFAEYATTEPALKGVKRVFENVVRCPYPKKKIRVDIEFRDKQNVFAPVFTTMVDPADYHIRRETMDQKDKTFEIQNSGDPHERVDVVFLAEGYTADEQDKFKSDVQRMTTFMFASDPYRELKDRFNVRGVFRASVERGTDQPRQGSFKSTVLDSTYNIFDLDRYLLLEKNHLMHRIAAQVPYDTIVVLVNTKRYGGGSICLDYCTSSVDDPTSEIVFLHEFGHSFAYLADEYIGNVAYNDMYPIGVEPVEPNITRELDPTKIKWKAFLSPGVSLPTPKSAADSKSLVGAFEGGGYVAKGMYRSELQCRMGSNGAKIGFCAACTDGIKKMVEFYAPKRE